MSKITFRADDDLIEQLEEFDASKSEIMREALREFLDDASDAQSEATASTSTADTTDPVESIDDLIAERVDAIVGERLDGAFTPSQPQDINVNIALDGEHAASADASDASASSTTDASNTDRTRKTGSEADENVLESEARPCTQCGETISAGHVYCPNCGEKASHRVFCDCGDELRSDWAFCPGCGRRTPAADVLDQT
ncbi:zinc ribbon domain-containing protein [Halosimplex aquaticum]|uniref:Zinc ribbon domain-containing protein n=1 Tax=Halosimplex aquaticum TaxID=3026162 RepID=A0ABD5Y1X0_9EURY|nr:zinc ribbon domain-containing protein [Halosimplex aquaticum]